MRSRDRDKKTQEGVYIERDKAAKLLRVRMSSGVKRGHNDVSIVKMEDQSPGVATPDSEKRSRTVTVGSDVQATREGSMGPPPIRSNTTTPGPGTPRGAGAMGSLGPGSVRVGSSLGGADDDLVADGDAVDARDLQDALTSAGVDLRSEEMMMSNMNGADSGSINGGFGYNDNGPSRPMQAFTAEKGAQILDQIALKIVIERICARNNVRSPADMSGVSSLLSLAFQERLKILLEQMVNVAAHRITSEPIRSVNNSLWKAFVSIAQAEREREEQFADKIDKMRESDELESQLKAAAQESADDDKSGSSLKRKKLPSATAAARQITVAAQTRLSNATALKGLGGRKYSWLSSGTEDGAATASPTPGSRSDMSPYASGRASPMPMGNTLNTKTRLARWMPKERVADRALDRPLVLSVRDVLEVLEHDRFGMGRIVGRGGKATTRAYMFQ